MDTSHQIVYKYQVENNSEQETIMINFRDLADSSSKLRRGKVYRSAGPLFRGIHPELAHIKTWIDLRMEHEWENCPLPQFPQRVPVPMDLADSQFHSLNRPTSQDWAKLYQRGFERNLRSFAEVLRFIQSESKPILFSCAVGRDRTGVVAAFLLYILGVENRAIIDDYCRTSEVAADLALPIMPRLLDRGLSQDEVLHSFFICQDEVMAALLDYFYMHEGKILAELAIHGFEHHKIADLRRGLLR